MKVLFRGLLHINAVRKAIVVYLMRWWQLFSWIFLCSYSFLVHLKFIFTVRASWKVVQGKTKFTLLTFVKSEEDDPLGPTPLDTYLLYYLLWGLSPYFLLLERIIIKEWDFKLSAKAQVLAPTAIFSIYNHKNLLHQRCHMLKNLTSCYSELSFLRAHCSKII